MSFALVALLAIAPRALAEAQSLMAGPPSLVSAPPVYAPASGAQWIRTLVPTNNGWIAFWADDVGVFGGGYVSRRRLMATRLTADGTVRDTTGLRVATAIPSARFDAVPNASGARLFWSIPGDAGFTLHTATISDDGVVSPDIVVGTYPGDAVGERLEAAAWGSRAAVMHGRYVMIVDGTSLVRTVDLGGWGEPQSITLALSRFVVTWVAAGNVLMRQTLSLDGDVIGPEGGVGVASPAPSYALASDGTNPLLAWSDAEGLHIGSVDDLGTGRVIETALLPAPWVWPHAVWSGTSYLVAWYSYEDGALLGLRVQSGGHPLSAESLRLYEGEPGYFELAANGSEVAMLHQTGGCIRFTCESDVLVAMLGPEASGERLISAAARTQTEPSVASDGEGFLMLWREATALFAARTTARSRIPSTPIPLGDMLGYSTSVASDGSGYMTAGISFREGSYSIEGAALTPQGDSLLREPFSLPAGQPGPSSASIGAAPGLYLIAWTRGGVREAARVNASGEVVDSVPITLSTDAYVYLPLSVAFDGEDFVVVWFSVGNTEPSVKRVDSARVSPGGTARFDRNWVTTTAAIQGTDLECGKGICLIVWIEQASPSEQNWHLRGQRFRTGGSPVDASPFDIDVADRTQTRPSVAWDGSRFIVTWDKYTGDVTPSRLEARVVPAAGAVAVAPPDLLVDREAALYPPATTCNAHGHCVTVGQQFVDDEELGRTTRLFKRFFGEARHRTTRR